MSSIATSAQVVDGDSGALGFTVTVNVADSAAVPVLSFDTEVLAQQGAIDRSIPKQYTVHLMTLPTLPAGSYSGVVDFRLCSDSACRTVYDGATQAWPYAVTVSVGDWQTFQRNSAHTGFVNARFDPTHFAALWTWARPSGSTEPIGGINSVASGGGKVFVSNDIYFGEGVLYALDETTGGLNWSYSVGPMASEGPPAFANGTVHLPSMDGAEQGTIWSIDAGQGTYRFKTLSPGQWTAFFAPTISNGSLLQTTQAGVVYSNSSVDGSLQWSALANAGDQTTPAADSRYVYQYGIGGTPALDVFDKTSGIAVASIVDPFASGFSGYSMFSSPMLGSRGNAIAFSGGGFSGRAASSSEQFASRVLVNYDIASKAYTWRSVNAYLTHPAIASGVVYAARNTPATLDALSEVDGHVLWSWIPPSGDASFHRNMVVTNNLLFVSTDAHVYAIDLVTHQPVWNYPKPGMLAISASSVLYIVTGATISDGNLVAIALK